MNINELRALNVKELQNYAKKIGEKDIAGFKKQDLIPSSPFPQYSMFESLTETEKDILLFSIWILFSLKKLIRFG